tara:strand:- start:35 stop:1198 length:1164 start_codon:yes stop_codon:yes gene_type:complete
MDDSGIYINCQPIELNGEDGLEIKTPNKIIFKPLESVFGFNEIFSKKITGGNDIKYSYFITCILIIIIICIPLFYFNKIDIDISKYMLDYEQMKPSKITEEILKIYEKATKVTGKDKINFDDEDTKVFIKEDYNNKISKYISIFFVIILGLFIFDEVNTILWYIGIVFSFIISCFYIRERVMNINYEENISKILDTKLNKNKKILERFNNMNNNGLLIGGMIGYFFTILATLMSLFLFFLNKNVAWLKKFPDNGALFFFSATNIIILLIRYNFQYIYYVKKYPIIFTFISIWSFIAFCVFCVRLVEKQRFLKELQDDCEEEDEGFENKESFIGDKCKRKANKTTVELKINDLIYPIFQLVLFIVSTITIQSIKPNSETIKQSNNQTI